REDLGLAATLLKLLLDELAHLLGQLGVGVSDALRDANGTTKLSSDLEDAVLKLHLLRRRQRSQQHADQQHYHRQFATRRTHRRIAATCSSSTSAVTGPICR